MIKFDIKKPNNNIKTSVTKRIDNLTKPKGSLGMLEEIAIKIACIQDTITPKLSNPCHIIFAGDHGIASEKVSLSPQEVTYQMVINFLKGNGGINFLVRQHNFDFQVIDAGVNYDFNQNIGIVNKKIRKSTRNYLYEPAITIEEMEKAIEIGAQSVTNCMEKGCNIISFGEMGITNTSSSSLWMSCLTGIDLKLCVGAGCDNSGNIVTHKYNILKQALDNYKGDKTPENYIRYFGGYEMVMTIGAMLKAAELNMIIIIDGFIMTSCLLAASKINKNVLEYAIYGHQGDEYGHKLILDYLNAKPILNLKLRLGEGTGAVCAYPIIDSAVRMLNEMNTFEEMNVTKYFK